MPQKCPIKKLGVAECLLCLSNKYGLCIESNKFVSEIQTLAERVSILEAQIENIRYLEDIENIETRLIILEELATKLEQKIPDLQKAIETLNTLQETVNLTLSKFSKRLLTLEENEVPKKKYQNYEL